MRQGLSHSKALRRQGTTAVPFRQGKENRPPSKGEGNLRKIIVPTLYLAISLLLALLSSYARSSGQFNAAGVLAVIALILAVVVSLTLVPRLWKRVQQDYLHSIRYFRFTRRGSIFTLSVLCIAFASFNTGNNLLILVLSMLLSSMIVSGMVANAVLRRLKVSINLPKNIHAGQRVVLFLTLENLKKWFPSFALRLQGGFESPSGKRGSDSEMQERAFPFIPPGEKLRIRLEWQFPRRGLYRVDGFYVRTSFPFGFFVRGRKLEVQGGVVVFPALIDLGPVRHAFPHLLEGQVEANEKGIGSSLYNVRPYRSGDRARFVHWKASAKMNRLMVKDFAREEDRPLNVVFSTYLPDPGRQALQRFESAVSLVASLAEFYHIRGHRFTLLCGDFEVSINGHQRDYETLMQFLAQVEPSSQPKVPLRIPQSPSILLAAGDAAGWEGASRIDYLRLPVEEAVQAASEEGVAKGSKGSKGSKRSKRPDSPRRISQASQSAS